MQTLNVLMAEDRDGDVCLGRHNETTGRRFSSRQHWFLDTGPPQFQRLIYTGDTAESGARYQRLAGNGDEAVAIPGGLYHSHQLRPGDLEFSLTLWP